MYSVLALRMFSMIYSKTREELTHTSFSLSCRTDCIGYNFGYLEQIGV